VAAYLDHKAQHVYRALLPNPVHAVDGLVLRSLQPRRDAQRETKRERERERGGERRREEERRREREKEGGYRHERVCQCCRHRLGRS
jgi:hypothetical protein